MLNVLIGLIVGAVLAVAAVESRQNENYSKCKSNGGKLYKNRRGGIFYEQVCVFNNEVIKGGIKIGKGDNLPPEVLAFEKTKPITKPISKKKTYFALILGIIGLVAWALPIVGLPIQIYSLVIAIRSVKSFKKIAVFTIVISIIGLVLSIVNASIGAYQGATGTHSTVNQLLNSDY